MRFLIPGSFLLAAAIAQQSPGTFPAMQRAKADPQVVERGKAVFGINCVACHGADLRGGQLNGPNLLRSQLVLADKDGELIEPVIKNGRPERGMPALPLNDEDVKAVIEFMHSLTAASPGQGAPPRTEAPPPDIVVGDAGAGRAYFDKTCSSCHAIDGDLRGIATRVDDDEVQRRPVAHGSVIDEGHRNRARAQYAPELTGECDVLADDESDELRHVLPHHKEAARDGTKTPRGDTSGVATGMPRDSTRDRQKSTLQ